VGATPTPTPTPPPDDGDSICQASAIDIDSLALKEFLPLVGVPFGLTYSSERLRAGYFFNPMTLGLGGWAPDVVHRFDVGTGTLYTGSGGSRRSLAPLAYQGGLLVTNASGSEAYVFDMNGAHLRTLDGLTGLLKYSIAYDSLGRVSAIADRFANTTSFAYSGGLVITSPYGQTTIATFGSSGMLASLVNPNGEAYAMTYNAQRMLTSFQKPMGGISQFTFDNLGFLIKDQGAGGNSITLNRALDPATGGQTVTATTALGRTTTYQTTATATSSLHATTSPDGGVSTRHSVTHVSGGSSNAFGETFSATLASDPVYGSLASYRAGASFVVPNSVINIQTQTVKAADLGDPASPFSFSQRTNVTTLQNDVNRRFTSIYSAANKETITTSPLGRVSSVRLNSNGLLSRIKTGSLEAVDLAYDTRGRLIETRRGSRTSHLAYDANGNLASSTDPLGRVTRFEYDLASRMTKQVLPDGNFIAMTYDRNGNMTSLTPPGKTVHSFSYNLFELLEDYLPPALAAQVTGVTTYRYSLDRELTEAHRPDGTRLDYHYDAATGRLTSLSAQSGAFTLSYLPQSSLVSSITSPDGVVTNYQYAGQYLLSETNSGVISSAFAQSYHSDGSIAAISAQGASSTAPQALNVSYDRDGLLVKFGEFQLTRDTNGQIESSTLGQVSSKITYDKFGAPILEEFKANKKTLSSQRFTRDSLGRIVGIEADKQSRAFEFDKQGRLTKVYDRSRLVREYRFDANGNRVAKIDHHGRVSEVTTGTYDAQDRLVRSSDTEYQYNANGELVRKIEHRDDDDDRGHSDRHTDKRYGQKHGQDKHGQSHRYGGHCRHHGDKITEYKFDSFGNLKSVILPNGKVIEYILDGKNRRVAKKLNGQLVQAFVYQSQTQIAAELDGSGRLVKRFIYDGKPNSPDAMIMGGKHYRIISDQVGTPRLVADAATGKIAEELEFDEFGVPQERDGKTTLPFGFAGGLHDRDTGLVHFGARDYDPETGRWLSKDPILFGGKQTNLYAYTMNDPVNLIDPFGQAWSDVSWGNVVGGGLLVGGGLTLIGWSGSVGPIGYVGIGVGTGAVFGGGVLLLNEWNNLIYGPNNNPFSPTNTSNGPRSGSNLTCN